MSAVAIDWPKAETKRRPDQLRALVLNSDFQPLCTWPLSLISAQDAIHALYRNRVTVVENWDAMFHSPSRNIPIPKVIALKHYAPVNGDPKFCRRSILLRDRYSCCYCGQRFPSEELTFDHVIPRSKGGGTTWQNVLTACLKCNGQKADKHANYSGRKGVSGSLRPLKQPKRPTSAELLRAGLEFLPNDVREEFGDYLYWNIELEA